MNLGPRATFLLFKPQNRDQFHVPCIDRWILNHWTTREVQLPLVLEVLVTQLCLTLWDPINCSLSGPSVHGIQARRLGWVTSLFSTGSS